MDSRSASNRWPTAKPLGSLGRDEMNLAEFPIALLTDRVPKDQTTAVYQDEIFDERTGRTLARTLTISTPNGEIGLTTAIDDEIILALIQLTKLKNNFTQRKIEFSRHELIQLLGWPRSGASYDRIGKSLDRWTSVFLKYENAWRDNRTKTWKSIGFHIIDKYEINDSRTLDDQLDLLPSFILWGEDIFESFQAGYLKPLDYDLCMGLSNSTAKRMYRFLDKRFHHKPDWIFELKEFAHRDIGLSTCYEGPAHLKRNLKPALCELEKVGFLAPLTDEERFFKEGKAWKVRIAQKVPSPDPSPATQEILKAVLPPSPLVAELVKRGVTASTAAELVQKHHDEAEVIESRLEIFDWMTERNDKRLAQSPAGYLVTSITRRFATPKGFITKAERERREAAKREQEDRLAASRRADQESAARTLAEDAAVKAYWDGLPESQRSELEAAALAAGSDETRSTYQSMKRNKAGEGLLAALRRDYIRSLLVAKQSVELA